MDTGIESDLCSFLAERTERDWSDALRAIFQDVHPVDREATLIWFAFWPLKLARIARERRVEDAVREFELAGSWDLREQIAGSIAFLHGSRYWPDVRRAALEVVQQDAGGELEHLVRRTAGAAAARLNVPTAEVLGISAVALMVLQQVGIEPLQQSTQKRSTGPDALAADDRVAARKRSGKRNWLRFLQTVTKYQITWDESRRGAAFEACEGQDISMAAASDRTDYTAEDPRRVEGPVPVQCRSGACGSCWIGVLGGHDNLSELTEFEQRRLRHFGYAFPEWDSGSRPSIRLACQTLCHGDATIVVPPWNGVLKGRE